MDPVSQFLAASCLNFPPPSTGDHPANGYSYLIALNPHPDLKILAGQDMVKELTMVAKGDVEQQRYEKLVEALKATRQFGGD